jgi:hypothetical protein
MKLMRHNLSITVSEGMVVTSPHAFMIAYMGGGRRSKPPRIINLSI